MANGTAAGPGDGIASRPTETGTPPRAIVWARPLTDRLGPTAVGVETHRLPGGGSGSVGLAAGRKRIVVPPDPAAAAGRSAIPTVPARGIGRIPAGRDRPPEARGDETVETRRDTLVRVAKPIARRAETTSLTR